MSSVQPIAQDLTDCAKKWRANFQSRFQGRVEVNFALALCTYYQIGGAADLVLAPEGLSDLEVIREFLATDEFPFLILGFGSNVLVSDTGIRGVVIRTHRMNLGIKSQALPPLQVSVGVSVANSTFLRRAIQEGWGGAEFLVGIPGSIGGAVWMNAGTFLGETKDFLRAVTTYDLRLPGVPAVTWEGSSLVFSYRCHHFIPSGHCVWATHWQWRAENPENLKRKVQELLIRRKQKQPIEWASCGSVFKNPENQALSAWQIVDRLGFRGKRLGQAQVSEQHANFIINLGGAKASEVRGLIQQIQQAAVEQLGIVLEPEVRFLGDFEPS